MDQVGYHEQLVLPSVLGHRAAAYRASVRETIDERTGRALEESSDALRRMAAEMLRRLTERAAGRAAGRATERAKG